MQSSSAMKATECLRKACGEQDLIITVPNISTQSCFVFTALLFTARKLKVFYGCTIIASSSGLVASSNF
jgi:hypothetical protein